MRKKMLLVGFVFLIAMTVVMTAAYAGGEGASGPMTDFWNSVGGFFYNALPWNWGNWLGK